jgi:hypothetical protein
MVYNATGKRKIIYKEIKGKIVDTCVITYVSHDKGVGMLRAEIGLKNRQIINETYSFHCFLIL